MSPVRPSAGASPRGRSTARRAITLLTAIPVSVVAVGGGVAFADNVVNDVETAGEVVSTTVDAPATVSFRIVATDGTREAPDAQNCNATATSKVTLVASGEGVVVDHNPNLAGRQDSFEAAACGEDYPFTFTSTSTGDKAINVAASGGKQNSTFNTSGATFTLRVAPATVAAAATSLSLASATGTFDQASTNLMATLRSGTTPVAGKAVAFTVGGAGVGSATTDSAGVATLAYALNKTKDVGSYATGASWAGDTSFAASQSTASTLNVTKGSQVIAFDELGGKVFGAQPFTVSGTAGSGLPVSFSSLTSSVCSVTDSTVTILTAGSCTVRAAQAGDGNWNAATNVDQPFTIDKAAQTVALELSRTSATFRDGSQTTVTGTASPSGLPVTLAATGPCTLSATSSPATVTLTGAGNCQITGSQAGNGNYNPATPGSATLAIDKANQTITFAELAPKTFGNGTFSLGATSDSELPVSYTAAANQACTVSGSTVTIVSAGACDIVANQAGNTNFNSASAVTRTLTVNKAAQEITFATLGHKTFGDAAFTLTATAPGGTVTFATPVNGPCTVNGTQVTLTGAGTCSITASQAGGTNHNAATDVTRTFTISKAPTTVTNITTDPAAPVYADTMTVSATVNRAHVDDSALTGTLAFTLGGTNVGNVPVTNTGSYSVEVPASAVGSSNLVASFSSSNTNYGNSSGTESLTVAPRAATAAYTGGEMFWGTTSTATTAAGTFSATVTSDGGDIRNARVSFLPAPNSAPFQGCSNLPVGLVGTSTTTGSASCQTDLTTGQGGQHDVIAVVTGAYTGTAGKAIVTASPASGTNSIAGGGHLVARDSAGILAATPGSKSNFGMSIKYNKGGTNLQGALNVLWRQGDRVYQAKATAISSLGVALPKAQFASKGNVLDVTDPLNPVSLDGGVPIQVWMTDGNPDTIGVQVNRKDGGIWFSSNWASGKTIEQATGGGQLAVR